MNAAAILGLVIEILQYAPQLKTGMQDVVDAAKQMWAAASADTAPTQDQLDSYMRALEAAHSALQSS